ncbi:MAG: hypothetical protein R8G66_14795 [Cytophagales bacterium]|nr:hypothetical protein [Cytophagales bacterium]
MHSPLQINDFRWKETGLWLLKVVVLAGCVYYISQALGHRSYEGVAWQELKRGRLWLLSGLVLLLVPLNWYLEVVKWRICVAPLTQITSRQALWSVLRGLSLNWVIPFTLGDFIGRSLNLPKNKGAIRANLVNRFASLWTTLFMFALASMFYWPDHSVWTKAGVLLTLIMLVFAIIWDKHYSMINKLKLLAVSSFRYLVFSLQFGLLLFHFCPDLSNTLLMAGIPVVFLIRTLAPSLLGALGVREAAVIWTFAAYTALPGSLLVASLFLWLFNLVLPSLVGLLPILAYRFKLTA